MPPAEPRDPMLPLEQTVIIGLRAAFPGWNIWRSDEGRWWASRRAPLPPSQQPNGYDLTLTATGPRLLTQQITRQPDHTSASV